MLHVNKLDNCSLLTDISEKYVVIKNNISCLIDLIISIGEVQSNSMEFLTSQLSHSAKIAKQFYQLVGKYRNDSTMLL